MAALRGTSSVFLNTWLHPSPLPPLSFLKLSFSFAPSGAQRKVVKRRAKKPLFPVFFGGTLYLWAHLLGREGAGRFLAYHSSELGNTANCIKSAGEFLGPECLGESNK